MKKKAFITTLISTFSVVGLIFVLVLSTIKENYSYNVDYPVKDLTIARVENGKIKNSSESKSKSAQTFKSVQIRNLDIPQISTEKEKISTPKYNGESNTNEGNIEIPNANYKVREVNRNVATLPNANSSNSNRNVNGGGNNVSMSAIAAVESSRRNNTKTSATGYVSTISSINTTKPMAGQKFNADSPPPSEKETPSLPIGDGWSFLILLGVVYVGFKKWLISK